MTTQIVIARRFCGPPTSGNGGYVCGLMASFVGGPVTGILRSPVPLETPLELIAEGQSVRLFGASGELIGEAHPADRSILANPPAPPTFSEAQAAGDRFPGLARVFHPICFTCSSSLAEDMGLRVFTGQVEGASQGVVAGLWSCHAAFADQEGLAPLEVVWAAMDCPGSVAWLMLGGSGGLLGTMTCEVLRRPAVGEPCIITAWPIEASGRKSISGIAMYATGDLIARARQIWIGRPPAAGPG